MKKSTRRASIIPLLTIEILFGSILAALIFLVFIDLSHRVLADSVQVFDQTITEFVHSFRSPQLTLLMLFISFFGGTTVLLVSSAILFLVLLRKRYRPEAILFFSTVATGIMLNLLLKFGIGRARPDVAPIIQEIFYSYPSGHSMNAFVFFSLAAYLTFHFTRNIPLSISVTIGSILLIICIGISRVYLGVHYPSDVLAGFLAGAGWLLTILVIERTLRAYRFYRGKRT